MSICDKCNHKSVCGFQDNTTLACSHFQKEVVRCKDCKYYTLHYYAGYNKMENGCSNNKGIWTKTQPDDFCSYGERKEGECGANL